MADQESSTTKAAGIYAIVNTINGKRYIGSAKSLDKRLKNHRWRLARGTHHNRILQSAWKKYGEDSFRMDVLLTCVPADLVRNEQLFIDMLRPEYNLCPTAGSTLGVRFSAEAKAKISAKALGRKYAVPRSQEHRAKISAIHKGKPKSPESIAKMRATKKGKTLTAEHRAKIGKGGRKAWETRERAKAPEHRAKISATLKGVRHSPERRAKQAAGQRGLKRRPYKRRHNSAQLVLL